MRIKMMLKQLKGLLVCLVFATNYASAADSIEQVLDPAVLPSLNADEGRIGEVRRVTDDTEFKVCSDPDNMPYSNLKQEGFEDKIAQVLANDLGKKLTFAYAYNRQGFLRNTINAMRCDVIIGTTSDYDALRTSKPYYRSGHVFVWRKDSGFNITNWDSPDLKKGVIGVIGQSPATIPLRDHDLIGYSKPYRMQRDLNLPTSFMIDDLAKKEIDVAVMWGPIAGYYAKKSPVPMDLVFIPEYNNVDLKGKEYWNISVGVRKKDKARMADIDAALERNKDKIAKILADYGIPTVPVVEGDSVFKKSN
ncbi:MAG: ABC transporter substrate-binding protein [Methylophilaceae bacterium 17-43-7]|nr:MAG: ABC transporter substrate-binding protein [Methylophilales bacterium 28-44-11]OYZ69359.1 MAG: ABC transporter substrate-binding protein [Methylophilaceae bacterium 17-43-7]